MKRTFTTIRIAVLLLAVTGLYSTAIFAVEDEYFFEYQQIRDNNAINKPALDTLISNSKFLSDSSPVASVYAALLHSNVGHPTGFEQYRVVENAELQLIKPTHPILYYRHKIIEAYNHVVYGNWEDAYAMIDAVIQYAEFNDNELYFDAMTAKGNFLSRAGLRKASLNILSDLLDSLPMFSQKQFSGSGYIEMVELEVGLSMSYLAKYERAIELCSRAEAFFVNRPGGTPLRAYQIALDCQRRSYIGSNQMDKADQILNSYISFAKEIGDMDSYAYGIVLKLEHMMANDQPQQAIEIIAKESALISSLPVSYDTVTFQIAKFKMLVHTGQIQAATQLSKKIDTMIESIPNGELLQAQYRSIKGDLFVAVGDTQKALEALRESKEFFENLYFNDDATEDAFGDYYESEIAERKLELLTKEHELSEYKLASTKILNGVLMLSSIILVISVVLITFLYKKQIRLKLKQELLASTDSLTGLKNRRSIIEAIEQEVDKSERYNLPLAVALIDLDHFKLINDRYGHNIGDELLKKFAEHVRNNIRKTDIFGRYGGEEFLLILPMTTAREAKETITHILNDYKSTTLVSGIPHQSFSAGIAVFQPLLDVTNLIKLSDDALYKAKNLGRAQVQKADQCVKAEGFEISETGTDSY